MYGLKPVPTSPCRSRKRHRRLAGFPAAKLKQIAAGQAFGVLFRTTITINGHPRSRCGVQLSRKLAPWLTLRVVPRVPTNHKILRSKLMFRDLRFAIRQLRKSPAFTATSLLTLAIGIGANTAIFSVMDAIVLRPLAVPDMNRVVTVYDAQNPADDYPASAMGKYEDWLRQSHSFEDLAIRTNQSLTLTGAGEAAHVTAAAVSANFFGLLRLRP